MYVYFCSILKVQTLLPNNYSTTKSTFPAHDFAGTCFCDNQIDLTESKTISQSRKHS